MGDHQNYYSNFQKKGDDIDKRDDRRTREIMSIYKIIIFVVVIIIAVISLLNSIYQVKVSEQAVLTTFGKYTSTISKSGLNFKIPFAQKIKKVNIKTREMTVGYGKNEEGVVEDRENESVMITKDFNIVNVDFYVTWQVTDPKKFLYATSDPEAVLRNLIQSAIKTTVGQTNVDDVITTGRAQVQGEVKQNVSKELDQLDIGIGVNDVSLQDATPPNAEVKKAFSDVENAKQNMQTALNNANQKYNETIPAKRTQADKILKDAQAKKQARIDEANGEFGRFKELYDGYQNNPKVTKKRMYYEVLSEILPGMKVIITDSNDTSLQKMYPVESFSGTSDTPESEQETSETSNLEGK